jgi:hypothetical protein
MDFFSFFKKYEKKTHNMFSLMLDAKLKIVRLLSSFIVREQGKAIVEECDKKIYFLYF